MPLTTTLQALLEDQPGAAVAQALCQELSRFKGVVASWVVSLEPARKPRSWAWLGAEDIVGRPEHPDADDFELARELVAETLAQMQVVRFYASEPRFKAWSAACAPQVLDSVHCAASLGGLADRLGLLVMTTPAADSSQLMAELQATPAILTAIGRNERRRALERALSQAGNSVFLTDEQGTILWTNTAFSRLTGYEAHEVLGKNPRILKSGKQSQRYYRKLWATISSGRVWTAEAVDHDKFGYAYAIRQTISPVHHGQAITHYLSVHDDVTQRVKLRAETERKRHVDWRTGLLTVTSFRDALFSQVRSAESAQQDFSVVSAVICNFDTVADALDGDATDLLYDEVGKRVRGILGPRDLAGAMAEGDFGLLLDGTINAEMIARRMAQLQSSLQQPFPVLGDSLHLRLRYGAAHYPADSTDPDELWRMADDAIAAQE